jgi:AAA domain-containing protein
MRVAVSGTHATGKSTLIAELARQLPGYEVVDEPYDALADEGHAFTALPSVDDFEVLRDRSIADLEGVAAPSVLFDRCPADYFAYLTALRGADAGPSGAAFARATAAMARLDLIVFVPIERPDRIEPGIGERRRLRTRVDALLRAILLDGGWALRTPVLEVTGTPAERARHVLQHLAPAPQPTYRIGHVPPTAL